MERQIEDALQFLFDTLAYVDDIDLNETEEVMREAVGEVKGAASYEEAAILTTDRGVRVELEDGRELYLTINVQ